MCLSDTICTKCADNYFVKSDQSTCMQNCNEEVGSKHLKKL